MVSAMQGCNYWFPSIACILALLAGSVLVAIEQVARHDESAGKNLSLYGGNEPMLIAGIVMLVVSVILYLGSDIIVGMLDSCGMACVSPMFAGGGSAVASTSCECCTCCRRSSSTSPSGGSDVQDSDFEAQREHVRQIAEYKAKRAAITELLRVSRDPESSPVASRYQPEAPKVPYPEDWLTYDGEGRLVRWHDKYGKGGHGAAAPRNGRAGTEAAGKQPRNSGAVVASDSVGISELERIESLGHLRRRGGRGGGGGEAAGAGGGDGEERGNAAGTNGGYGEHGEGGGTPGSGGRAGEGAGQGKEEEDETEGRAGAGAGARGEGQSARSPLAGAYPPPSDGGGSGYTHRVNWLECRLLYLNLLFTGIWSDLKQR